MKVSTYLLKNGIFSADANFDPAYQLVIGFGSKHLVADKNIYKNIAEKFPGANILLCSTAGEIHARETYDDCITLTAIHFSSSSIRSEIIHIADFTSSYAAGQALASKLDTAGLRSIFILSDGNLVNGSELVRGMENCIANRVPVTGGLAGDGTNFESTVVGLNDVPGKGNIAAIGFYGENLKVAFGSMGGWEMFGLERTVTKSVSNVLYEIDGKDALSLYKQYLGKFADDLPGSALMFPLSIEFPGSKERVVRTILSLDSENNSMTFAGDMPVGSKVRFMKANIDNLVDAASQAAQKSLATMLHQNPKLAFLISCVGRKIVLDKRVDEEVEAVADILGEGVAITGFYSYGEISPLNDGSGCQLLNQTMTITLIDEN
jgi:hypothetical protein